jgi:hypothetical protein
MAYLDDVPLDKSIDAPPGGGGKGGGPWVAIGIVLLVVAVVAAVVVLRWPQPEEPVRTTTEQAVAEPAPGARAERGEDIELPPLDATDPVVRKLIQRLSSHSTVAAWLATKRLIRNFAVVTLNVSEGRTPVSHLRAVAPATGFRVRGAGGSWYLDPRSYQRYDEYADAVGALDPRGTARLYATLKPRIVEAYAELGVPAADVDAVLERAIVHLLATPIVEGSIRLREKTISYAFADDRLESLSPAQKQLLRMGPRNVRIIQAKLRDLAPYLGIPHSKLPAP